MIEAAAKCSRSLFMNTVNVVNTIDNERVNSLYK